MKRIALFFSALGLATLAVAGGGKDPQAAEGQSTANLPSVNNEAFTRGEMLEWRVHYGMLDAGIARIEIKEDVNHVGERPLMHIVGTGKSKGAFNWFYKVDDTYETWIDEQGVFPWVFRRRCNEGGYIIEQDYVFHQTKQYVELGEEKTIDSVPVGVQDMLSAFYFARTMDLSNMAVGDTLTVPTVVDGKLWPLQCKYLGEETVKVDAGKFDCLRFAPIVQKGRIFKSEEDLSVWITNDKNKIPVLAQANILVGSIKMELQEYDGLANPVAEIE